MSANPRFIPPIVQSAIAGISDGAFCQKILNYGAGMVTLGGFSIDRESHLTTTRMIERGRDEFLLQFKVDQVKSWCLENLNLEKQTNHQLVSFNVRLINADYFSEVWLNEVTKFVDIVEINAHCRQEEILKINGGHNLLLKPEKLETLLDSIRKLLPSFPLGIKIRGHIIGDYSGLTKILEDYSISYIHVDAMLPGQKRANIKIIRKFVELTDIPIIGNNSVRTINDIHTMLKAGAKAASVARPLMQNPEFMQYLVSDYTGRIADESNNNTIQRNNKR